MPDPNPSPVDARQRPSLKSRRPDADDSTVPDLLTSGRSTCPQCRATVRGDAPWCTLCHADLRPPPAPVAPPATGKGQDVRPGAGAPADAACWPCTTCGESNPIASTRCAACGAGFLARVRESEPPLLTLPVVGDIGRLSRAQGVALSFGVVAVVCLTVFLLGVLTS